MEWIIPGKPYKTQVGSKVVTIKSMTLEERREWALQFRDFEASVDSFERVVDALADKVIAISGVDMPVREFLSNQGVDILLTLQQKIITASAITEEQAKNLESSSDVSTPVKPGTQKTATGEAASVTETA